jgi:Flp pilus assembly protein TadD
VLIAAGLFTYWNSLRAPFVWDDDTAIVTNESIRRISALGDVLVPPLERPVSGRPVVNLSFAINYAVGGLDVTGYHVWNLAVHIGCALLLFGVLRRTLAALPRDASRPWPDDVVAAIAALIWLVHPLQSEVVDYVTQRSESMMALFVLLTVYASIRARSGTHTARWHWTAVVSCALAMATKESAVVAPVLVIAYDRAFVFRSLADAFRHRGRLYAALAATWLELGAIMWRWPRSTVGVAAVSPWTYFLNQIAMIAAYLRLSVWPHALVFDYGLPHAVAIHDVLPAALLLAALVAATVIALVRWPRAGFLGLAFFLTLAPTSSLVPIASEVGAERRMYLPHAALTTLAVILGSGGLAWLAARFRRRRPLLIRGAAAVTALVAVALAAATIRRNAEYATPLRLWQTVVERRPQGRARMAFANELVLVNRREEAIAQLRTAVEDFPDARAALGAELFFENRAAEAIPELREFVRGGPSLPNRIPARILLGQALAATGQLDEASRELQAVVRDDPGNPLARQTLADIAFGYRKDAEAALRSNDPVGAAAQAARALRLDPRDGEAHNLLGVSLAMQGQVDQAVEHFRQALAINPNDRRAQNNLARAAALARPPR